MKNIMYKAFLLIACSLCVLSCTDLDEEALNLNKNINIEEQEEAFFKLNESAVFFYSSDNYQHIYCDHNGGDNVSVTFANVPGWLSVKYNQSTHVIEIYNNHTSGSSTSATFSVKAVVKNKVFTETVNVTNNFSNSGSWRNDYNVYSSYEVSADTKTLNVNFSKSFGYYDNKPGSYWGDSSYENYYYVTSVGDSWVTGISPTFGEYNGTATIALTFLPNTTGVDRTTVVWVYTMKCKYKYNSSYNSIDDKYINYRIYTFNITQTAQ